MESRLSAYDRESIEVIVKSHVSSAFDQAYAYPSLNDVRDSYAQNVFDTAIEAGYTIEEARDALDWFIKIFRGKTGEGAL